MFSANDLSFSGLTDLSQIISCAILASFPVAMGEGSPLCLQSGLCLLFSSCPYSTFFFQLSLLSTETCSPHTHTSRYTLNTRPHCDYCLFFFPSRKTRLHSLYPRCFASPSVGVIHGPSFPPPKCLLLSSLMT